MLQKKKKIKDDEKIKIISVPKLKDLKASDADLDTVGKTD